MWYRKDWGITVDLVAGSAYYKGSRERIVVIETPYGSVQVEAIEDSLVRRLIWAKLQPKLGDFDLAVAIGVAHAEEIDWEVRRADCEVRPSVGPTCDSAGEKPVPGAVRGGSGGIDVLWDVGTRSPAVVSGNRGTTLIALGQGGLVRLDRGPRPLEHGTDRHPPVATGARRTSAPRLGDRAESSVSKPDLDTAGVHSPRL